MYSALAKTAAVQYMLDRIINMKVQHGDILQVTCKEEDRQLNIRRPDTYIRRSLLALLCCCPCGTVAVINALKVMYRYKKGDIKGANEASRNAERCSSISFLIIFLLVLTIALLIFCAALFGIFYGIDYSRGFTGYKKY